MTSIQAATLFNVDGLVAFVTGAGTGIGSYIAQALAENGAKKVYIFGRRLQMLEDVARLYPGIIHPIQGDVASQDDLKAAAEFIRSDTGYLNLVVANAGVSDRSALEMGLRPSIDEFQKFACSLEEQDWSKVFNINVTSAFFTVANMLDLLALGNAKHNVSQSSQVVVTSAIGGFLRGVPPGGFAYTLSKAAVTHLFKMLATILAPQKIRSNIICPGLYHSEMADPVIQFIVDADAEGKVSVVPEGRVGSPEDMAGVILFLASKAGSFCNGNVLITDGGTISQEPAVY